VIQWFEQPYRGESLWPEQLARPAKIAIVFKKKLSDLRR